VVTNDLVDEDGHVAEGPTTNVFLVDSEGVLSTNAMTDRRFSAGESVQAYGIRSAICVPIKFRERMFGVIYIDSRYGDFSFIEDQLRLMTAVGMQAGLALEHADLHQHHVGQARLAAVGETVASLSHSIRNMLQAIRGGAEVVDMGLRKKELELVGSGWDILTRNLDRVYELTMNMLAFSKQRQPEYEMTRLPHLLGEITDLFRPQCDRKEVKLLTKFDEDMPPVPLDPGGVHQAIMNLLNNALDAVEQGKGVITIECGYDPEKMTANIGVSDTGCGIDQQTLKQLFKPFFSTKGLRGTGLGLAVTRRIVAEHRGRIRVETKQGRGSVFRVFIPADLDEQRAVGADLEVHCHARAAPGGQAAPVCTVEVDQHFMYRNPGCAVHCDSEHSSGAAMGAAGPGAV